jgi:branched-subunit amino acid ABC-type transport system permease component
MLTGIDRTATINFNLSSVGFSGLYWSAVYLSIAIGLTLTYKVQRFANFAQAEMMLVGSYVALTLMWSDRFFPISNAQKDGIFNWELLIWAGISSFFIAGVLGLLVDRIVYRRLRDRMGTPQVMMIASLGVSMVLRALLYLRFSASTFRFIPDRDWKLTTSIFEVPTQKIQLHLGDRIHDPFIALAQSVNPYGVSYSKIVLIVGIFGVVALLLILLHRTRIGRQMRAVADNPDLAATSGIHVERVHGSTAFISAGIAGFGGALLAGILPINPELGLSLLLPAFAVIVLGTIGSVPGVIIGALIIGLLRAASEPVLIGAGNALGRPTASGFAEVVPFVFLVGFLLLAPKGIGSAIQDWNIERIRKKRPLQKPHAILLPSKRLWPARHMSKLMAYFTVYSEHVNELIHTTKEFLRDAITAIWESKAILIMFVSKSFDSYKHLMPSFNSVSLVPSWGRIRIDRERVLDRLFYLFPNTGLHSLATSQCHQSYKDYAGCAYRYSPWYFQFGFFFLKFAYWHNWNDQFWSYILCRRRGSACRITLCPSRK